MRYSRLAVATLLLCFSALRTAAAIQGTVMTSDGQPAAGARVSTFAFETPDARRQRLLSPAPEEVPLATVLTDAKGNFSLPSPKEPVVALAVFMRGYLPTQRRVEREEETGAIALLRSEFQTGTISAAGKPLAGATVVLSFGGHDYVTKSGEDGKYTAPDPKRARSIAVIHPSYAISEEAFPFGSGAAVSKLQRTLVNGSQLTGRVLGSDGKSPVAGATVSLDGWPLASSGEDGTFTIAHAHAHAKWNALVARKDASLGQRSFSNVAAHDIRLARGATISGRITDSRTKLPVPGTIVSAIVPRMDRGEVAASAATDAKGGFSLVVLPASYRLVAGHPAYDQKSSEAAGLSGQSVSKDLALAPLARVTGIVVDEGNKPVTAAAITTESASDPMGMPRMMRFAGAMSEAASGPDGRFSIRFPGDEDLRLKAVRKGLPVAKSETLKLAPGERKSGVVLTIASGVEVSGRVTDREGKPLSGVAVTTAEAESGRGGMQRIILSNLQQFDDDAVRTGSDGTFAMRLKEGTYDFSFKREGYATAHARAQAIISTGENTVEAKLEPAVDIRGRVVRSGSGVEGVTIAAMVPGTDARTTSGPDGSFTLGGLSPGQLRLSLRKDDDFVQEMRSITAPASDVVIELPLGTRVSGRVIDKASRKPVTQFQAGLSRSRSAGGMVMMAPPQLKGFTSEDGSFTLENVPSGAHDLVASAAGFASGRLNINVEEGKALSGLELELDTGTRLIGKVTGPTGTPLSDVRVNLSGGPGGAVARMGTSNASSVTDANGEYTLEALASGDETIEFSHQKYLGTSKTVSLKGREVRLDVQLEGGQRVSGVVVTEAGAPVADAEVSAYASGASQRGVRSNAGGMFEFESLAPARYRFGASKSGYSDGRVDDFDITSGTPLRITLKTGGTIYGRVSGLTRAELSNVSVDARAAGGSTSANVDSSGNYKIEGAPTGTVQVSATMMSSAMTGRRTTPAQTVQLDAGSSRQLDFEFSSDTVIRGRVLRNGVPLKGASISFTPRTGRSLAASSGSTDEDGMYSIAGLDDAEYNVSVMDLQRFSPYTTTYQVNGSATFNIDYKTNALRGRVIDAMTNAPLGDANVQLRSADTAEGFRGMRAATTDGSGAFILDGVSPGSYTANASKDGYGNDSRTIVVGERPPDDLELKISRSEGVTLRVVDARGGRSLDAIASVFDAQGNLVPDSRMRFGNTEGAADLKLNLAPGRYTASISAFGYATRTITFDSPSVQTVPMTPGGTLLIRSKRSTRSRVRLIDSSGAPYPRSSMRQTWFELIPSPGTTPIEHVAPGTYTLQLLGDNDNVLDTERVTITEGQTTNAEM